MASLSRRIAAWSASSEAYAIIDRHDLGSTWFSGGCPAFAVAAARWAGHPGSVVAVASGGGARGWRAQTTDSLRRSGGVAEHYVAEAGGWLIDADGACPPAVMLRRWREREGISRPHLVRVTSMSDEMESQRADYVCPAAAVSEIDAALRAALGPPDAYELDVPPRFSTTSATVSGLYDAVRSACVSRPREVAATLRAMREAAASAEAAGATDVIGGYDAIHALFDAIEREPQGSLEGHRDEAYDAVHALFTAQMRRVKGLSGFPYPSLDPADLAQRLREPIAAAYASDYAAYWLLWGAVALGASAWGGSDSCWYAAHMASVVIAACSGETRRDAEARVVSAVLAGINAPTRRPNPPKRKKSPSLFVSLRPDPKSASRIAAERGVDAGGLHVTLAFLGRVDELAPSAVDGARRACARAASGAEAIRAEAGRARRFPEANGTRVSYLPVRGAGLSSLRARVVRELEAEGLAVSRSFGFVPHITIGTSPAGHRPPPAGDAVPVTFSAVWVCVGHDMRVAARLRGGTGDHRTRRGG